MGVEMDATGLYSFNLDHVSDDFVVVASVVRLGRLLLL